MYNEYIELSQVNACLYVEKASWFLQVKSVAEIQVATETNWINVGSLSLYSGLVGCWLIRHLPAFNLFMNIFITN